MKYSALLFLFIFYQTLYAESDNGLVRINFYPKVKSYLIADYSYQNLHISTPKNAIDEKSVRNYRNILNLTYAFKFKPFFLGTHLSYEMASESAATYGIPSNERYNSQDFHQPSFFLNSRLREQASSTGNIDLYLSFAPRIGPREVGGSGSNRLSGKEKYQIRISHGLLEDDWEFKNSFEYSFFADGDEENSFTNKNYLLESYNLFRYSFTGQYEINPRLYLNASAAFEYRTIQKIYDRQDERREIQAGTGSIFRLGLKKSLSSWSVLEFSSELERYNYFVSGDTNLDGALTQWTHTLSFIQGF
jgi:hypothetical protein